MSFEFSHSKVNNHVVITAAGDLVEKSQAQPMIDQVKEYLEEDTKRIIIDLNGVRYLNSSGLSALISILTKTRSAGGETIICNVSPKVKELLIITRLNTVFTVTDTVQEAQQKLNEL